MMHHFAYNIVALCYPNQMSQIRSKYLLHGADTSLERQNAGLRKAEIEFAIKF